MTVTAPVARTPRATTLRKQEAILAEAERQFARFGFEGVSLDLLIPALLDDGIIVESKIPLRRSERMRTDIEICDTARASTGCV